MRNRVLVGLIAGVVSCALFLGAAVGVIYALDNDNDVEGRASHTWQMVEFDDWLAGETPRAFIEQLPADCELVPDPHDEWTMFYSCTEPFEPDNRPNW
jgi:hypothetical protein